MKRPHFLFVFFFMSGYGCVSAKEMRAQEPQQKEAPLRHQEVDEIIDLSEGDSKFGVPVRSEFIFRVEDIGVLQRRICCRILGRRLNGFLKSADIF